MSTLKTPFRYDFVGSFLRPEKLKAAKKAFEEGTITQEELDRVTDECVTEIVAKQKVAGYHAITDGEFRRKFWHLDFMWGFEGVTHEKDGGGVQFNGEMADLEATYLVGKVKAKVHPFVEYFKFLKQFEDEQTVAKYTIPAPAQMYQQKLVTYPRTDSQYLTDEMGESTETLIQMLLGKMPYAEGLEYHPDVSKVLNSKKVSDHHAIIPTMEVAKADIGELKERNRKILYLISARVLTATADPYIYESHKCQITCNYHTFYLTAKKTKQEGFKAIENKLKQFFGVKIEKEEPELDIWAGKHYGPCDSLVSEHFTQPPKQYTEDTLLSAMERAGNEELTEDTEKKGLGTPATRAAIIEKLIQSGFVKREKKNLVPTDDGNVLITVLPDEIKSPKMTAEWEMALNHIAQNTETADEFLNGITELMQELVARYQGISEEKKNQFQGKAKGEVIGKCPRCGADVQEGKVNFYCSDRNCTFTLWKNDKFLASQGKKMDKTAAKKFLSKGKIHYKDLVSRKTGRQYEATVEMVDPGEGNVQFNLIFPQR